MNNNSTNGNVSVRYQGPDTANALIDVPASAFFQANSAADLAATFTNNITLAATTSGSLDVAGNTTINGTLTMIGSGAGTALNVLGSGNLTALTIAGATTLTDNLAVVTPTANLTLGGAVSGAFGITKTGFGALTLGAANPAYTGPTVVTTGTLGLANANAVQNSAVSFAAGTGLQLRADANTTFTASSMTVAGSLSIDVDQATTGQTNKVLTLGNNLSIPAATISITGNSSGSGYSLALGATTLTGAVVFNPTTANVAIASVTGAFNLTLGGTSTGNSVGAHHDRRRHADEKHRQHLDAERRQHLHWRDHDQQRHGECDRHFGQHGDRVERRHLEPAGRRRGQPEHDHGERHRRADRHGRQRPQRLGGRSPSRARPRASTASLPAPTTTPGRRRSAAAPTLRLRSPIPMAPARVFSYHGDRRDDARHQPAHRWRGQQRHDHAVQHRPFCQQRGQSDLRRQ